MNVNKIVEYWTKGKEKEAQKILIEIEEDRNLVFERNKRGICIEEESRRLKMLEEVKRKYLEQEEVKWRLKSGAIFLVEGDEHTFFFLQDYDKHCKNINSYTKTNSN